MKSSLKREIVRRLKVRVGRAEGQITQEQLAADLKISQGLVSKIMKGDFERRSKSIDAICHYLEIDTSLEKYTASPLKSPALMSALKRNWDGSERHALMIADFLDQLSRIESYHSLRDDKV